MGRAGKRRSSAHFVVLTARGRDPLRVRLGLAVSRRVGNAVERNRVKRRVRSWFRAQRSLLPEASDLVVIARSGAARLEGRQIHRELSELFE